MISSPQQEQKRGPRWRRPWRSAVVMAVGALAIAVAVTACGGGRSTPGVASGPTNTTTAGPSAGGKTTPAGLLAYSACMRSHGITGFPDPTGSGGIPKAAVVQAFRQVSNAQSQAAQAACQHLIPAGESLGGQQSQPVTVQDQQDYLKAANCMRAHGITGFPDPVFSGTSVDFPIPASMDTHTVQFTQAQHVCQRLIPPGLPYSGSQG